MRGLDNVVIVPTATSGSGSHDVGEEDRQVKGMPTDTDSPCISCSWGADSQRASMGQDVESPIQWVGSSVVELKRKRWAEAGGGKGSLVGGGVYPTNQTRVWSASEVDSGLD